ncbi:formylmethanofuran dehydrogenase [Thermosulfuriphilus ammonigenes]|uniref:Formylmethanofuran dehydrogenase n=1 Tax=Thermosulfuriphilus ammonigenes TaxID=1936021 RepID=A0A6G7PX99_9BACT|nr:FmdE family protein [Thermosulfuriphilus ammonigenes]MBA2849661.1 formylmethanofuran dehydrogenase subunit E [Thermosulfuriphilus ammonigenes]QIJ72240.1 formylmethanofuran dehydrogenase [Thermosulfuriphilus ammonigenes]
MKTLLEKEEFERLLAESVKTHGHLCPGQVLGVRLAMLGLKLIGIQDPKGADRKKFLVYVEIDRCATDAIQSVTGCTLGKRSLKFVDYGIMAATFVNLETNRAFRIVAREEARKLADGLFPEIDDRYRRQLEAYKALSDDDLFQVEEVKVDINDFDLPGRPRRRVRCQVCGNWVQDGRDIQQAGQILCRACAFGGYFRRLNS